MILFLLSLFLNFNFSSLRRLFFSHRLLLLDNRFFGYLAEELEDQVNNLFASIHNFLVLAREKLIKGVVQASSQILKTNLVLLCDGLDGLHLTTDCLQILKPINRSIRQC